MVKKTRMIQFISSPLLGGKKRKKIEISLVGYSTLCFQNCNPPYGTAIWNRLCLGFIKKKKKSKFLFAEICVQMFNRTVLILILPRYFVSFTFCYQFFWNPCEFTGRWLFSYMKYEYQEIHGYFSLQGYRDDSNSF